MLSKVKIGIVGTGRMGTLHLSKFQSLPSVDLVGIYDTDIERSQALGKKTGVRIFKSLEELVFNVDGLVIASPTSTHFAIAEMALRQGCHVLIEKPFCETIDEADKLQRLAETKRLICQIGFLERFRLETLMGPYSVPRVSKIQIQRLATSVGREEAVDVVSDLMIHDLDLILSIANEEPTSISGTGFSVVTDYLDFATARLEFPCGMVADLIASRISSVQKRAMQVISRGYSCEYDFVANSKFSSAKLRAQTHETQPISFDALEAQSKNFVEAIQGKVAPKVTAKDGIRVMASIIEIRKSILENVTILPLRAEPEQPALNREH